MATAAVKKMPATKTDNGLDAKVRLDIAGKLVMVLADTYTLMIKSHVYHWNVVGPLFVPLHELTEKHYKDLFEAADVIAERIRALGRPTPMNFATLLTRADVAQETDERPASEMVEQLIADHERTASRLRDVALDADEADDLVTTDMLTQRLAFHEKAVWMLRSIVSDKP